jgi:hypothetical protein
MSQSGATNPLGCHPAARRMRDSMNETEAAIAIDPARAVEVRDHQQRDWTEVKVVEEREDPGAIGERCRRDVVQRNTERARQFDGHAIRMWQ